MDASTFTQHALKRTIQFIRTDHGNEIRHAAQVTINIAVLIGITFIALGIAMLKAGKTALLLANVAASCATVQFLRALSFTIRSGQLANQAIVDASAAFAAFHLNVLAIAMAIPHAEVQFSLPDRIVALFIPECPWALEAKAGPWTLCIS